jgi:ubiquinone/menaquinone biosynthesis C-methylase UbiE
MQRQLEPEVMDTADEAAQYDAMDHREPNAAFVARLLALNASGRMLDLGTGPGHIPLLVCDAVPGCTVTGIDLSREMLAIAERRRLASPHAGRITYRLADAKALPFADATFDAVFSNTILHHIPDPRPFLREAARVLRPGGALLIRDLFRPPDERRLDDLVALHAGDATDPQRKMFRDSLMAALTPDELGTIAQSIGLTDARVVIDTDRHMSLQRPAG